MDRLDAYPAQIKSIINYARLVHGGATGNEKIFAFTPAQTIGTGTQWGIGIALLGEPGYIVNAVAARFHNYEAASEFCDTLHDAMGYSSTTAHAIIIDTMKRSEFKNEQQSDTISVKLSSEQLEHAIAAVVDYISLDHDSDVQYVLEDARDELGEKLASVPTPAR